MKIAVLAVQGAFVEHERMLEHIGAEYVELRKKEDLLIEYDGLVLPGGESTVQGKMLYELDMFDTLHRQISEGLPVLATCAGLILLADRISNDDKSYFRTLPVTVRRNAYGRQLGSFFVTGHIAGIGSFPMEFIRAPYIENAGKGVEILSEVDGNIVAVKYKNQLGMAFHPELCGDTRIHEKFISMI